MASKEEYDKYAAELTQRFEEFTRWAMENWPNKAFPLLSSDFAESRRELGEILGPKLGDGSARQSASATGAAGQYQEMNPMPWP